MPESKSRHPHKHPHQQDKHPVAPAKAGGSNRVVTIAVVFFAVIGLAIGFVIDSTNILLMLGSTVLGCAAGYFAGQQLKKSLSGK